tara:strand:+ start:358 stop:531 length:174 start_codon:yes stop_codon:yes gene_type:complete
MEEEEIDENSSTGVLLQKLSIYNTNIRYKSVFLMVLKKLFCEFYTILETRNPVLFLA